MKSAERKALERDLAERVGAERRANHVLLSHVFSAYAGRGALCYMPFVDHRLVFDPRDDKIGMTLLAGREWQRWLQRAALSALPDAAERLRGRIFLDVGANIGTSTIYALRDAAFRGAVAFEPEPVNRSILEKNLALNDLDDRVTVVACAAGATSGTVELTLDRKNFGRHSTVPGHVATPGTAIEVAVERVDDVIAASGFGPTDIGFAKIDVEGGELDVLAGMTGLLAAQCPLLIEVDDLTAAASGAGGRSRLDQLNEFLGNGYQRIAVVDASPVTDWTRAQFAPGPGQMNLLIY